ncbi:DEAD/DEAH box helicase [Heyndrickxia ginsengihumi]|uniref:DEAD/DEAH box helicase n=1 Tax=Heyndrickxia ginsengihumi TaxID=363870 RepID=UPI001D459E0D|nr:DEAD/DEAH box helicase [Heyndrickxia ginsengihumi]MBE6183363.1 DEAD/DEAH box helicase [Bacillus sp. (in: firmicutes)]MCM3024074.1 DEAD/DEAH box helicase [Heyndrickxia ginsengihumi]
MSDFTSLGIQDRYLKKLREIGIVQPTPIQEQAIPFVLSGKDVIAQAQTGTGKTFAFILPLLQQLDLNANYVQALIIAPTRELALQITEETEKLITDRNVIRVLALYGGQDVEKQLKKLQKNVQLIIGTPGRLLDHIRRGTIDLSRLSSLVLDEADQMLHIGFLNEVEMIMKETPRMRQTLLFSATMPNEVQQLAKKYMRTPATIQVEETQKPADNVKQRAIHTTDRAKQSTLMKLIDMHKPFLAIIFCRTKRRVSKLNDVLKAHKFLVDELHGDLSQAKREQVMKRFRDAELQLLVATDVAARGLDVEGVTHVFNYDIPQDAESYVHRIGRTGRGGMKGVAITFYSTADRPQLEEIEKELNITIPKQNIGNEKIEQAEKIDRSNNRETSLNEKDHYKKKKSNHHQSKRNSQHDNGSRTANKNEHNRKSTLQRSSNNDQAYKGNNHRSRNHQAKKKKSR